MPVRLQILLVLFAFFIFLCGAGHALRCMERTDGTAFVVTNFLTAVVSLATCLYLIPLVPSLMSSLDENLQSLKYLNEELEASKRKLMTFMAFLCHEIRNPLFVITSNISFLEDNNSAERPSREVQEQALQAISQSADVMLRLVNDVLDISKLESGKLELQEHDFDLRDTLEGVTNSTRRLIAQKHRGDVGFVTHAADGVPRCVFCDSVRFLQIVYNLLSNANKFTERGEIRFTVSTVDTMEAVSQGLVNIAGVTPPTPPVDRRRPRRRRRRRREGGYRDVDSDSDGDEEDLGLMEGVDYGRHNTTTTTTASSSPAMGPSPRRQPGDNNNNGAAGLEDHVILKLQVQDTGMGIPPDQIDRLFQPYAQSKLSNYRKQGGTGLGLAIVSKLTLAMGGNVRVNSEVGRGTSFEVYLPVQVTNCPQDPTNNSKNPMDGFSNFRKRGSFQNLDAATGGGDDGVELSAVSKPAGAHDATTVPPTPEATQSQPAPTPAPLSPALAPLAPTPAPPPAVSTTPSASKKLVPFDFPKGKGVVLVVDDNDMNRKLLKRMLSQFKLEHCEAADGQEAVNVMRNSRNFTQEPDAPEIALVLMDLSMPVMDGYEATSTIRQYRNCTQLPIIALTAATVEEGKQRAMEVGVTEYQTKPIKRDVLYRLCQRYLHNAASAAPQPPPDLLSS